MNNAEEKIREVMDLKEHLYAGRAYTQKDIAKELNIPVDLVSKCCRNMNYEHTKFVTKDNRNPGQYIRPINISCENGFLLKYYDGIDFSKYL